LIYTPLMREPLVESDVDDFVAAIAKVLRYKDALRAPDP